MKKLSVLIMLGLILTFNCTGWASFTQTEGLIAYWSFDNPSDPGHDDSGNGEDGTVYGATSTPGNISNALDFDGIDDWVDVPDGISPDYITLAAWIYPTGFDDGPGDQGNAIIQRSTGGAGAPGDRSWSWRLRIMPRSHLAQFQAAGPNTGVPSVIAPTALVQNRWYHLASTYDGNVMKIYVDGELKATNSNLDGPLETYHLIPVAIGCLEGWGLQHFQGIIDEVRIYDRALVPGPIEANIDIDPDTLNLNSKGKWITCYIELPEGYDVEDIDVSTIKLNDQVTAESHPTGIEDCDDDGITELMVKFERAAVQKILTAGDEVEITVTGELNGETFEGSDTIRVIDKGGKK